MAIGASVIMNGAARASDCAEGVPVPEASCWVVMILSIAIGLLLFIEMTQRR